MKTIFIVTHQHGFEADPVIDSLRRLDIPVFRFNLDGGVNASQVSFGQGIDDCRVTFSCDNRSISSDGVGVGWCQQLWPYINQITDQKTQLQQGNLISLQSESFDFIMAPWLNQPNRARRAANKVRQLVCAKHVGFNIPETLVSNNPNDIRKFCSKFPAIAKNLATPWLVNEQGTEAAYTRMVDTDWLAEDIAMSFSPVIYQRFYERKRDIRVVVVGNKVFAANCFPNHDQLEDVRLHGVTGHGFVPCEFCGEVMDRLFALIHTLSVEYCSADFMEDKDGKLYFLEANICGAWWWVDRLYDGLICKSITQHLYSQLVDI